MATNQTDTGYKIGAVARITGIGSETLRAWERRYSAVKPTRTESGDRQYSRDDVAKLLLLKSFVDAGVSIGSVASLAVEDLKQRCENDPLFSNSKTMFEKDVDTDSVTRVLLLGDSFPLRILDGLEEVNGIEITGSYENFVELERDLTKSSQPDVVIIERPTINSQTKIDIHSVKEITGAWHVILIYGFSTQENIKQLQNTQTTVVRSSVDVQELARLCIYHAGGSEKLPSLEASSTLHFEQTIPARRFSNKQLLELSTLSNTIKCECPKHITDLVRDLVNFEIYSAECENENADDAALHSYLHATTAQVRSMLEESLSHIIRVEGITIN